MSNEQTGARRHQHDLDGFLGHESRERTSVARLDNWKKRDDKAINSLLHTLAPLIALWQHNVPRIVTFDKDDVVRREAWGGDWNCIEPEGILKHQYKRDRDTGEREVPPTVCPMCILIETIRRMVADGRLKFCEPLFRWEGDDPDKARVITAAGIFNGYGSKNLTPAQKRAIAAASISLKHAWKQNAYAKCNYVFTVVDADNPDDGVNITVETTLLGDKVKEVIRDARVALGMDDGNPMKNPYVIRWQHRPDESEFNKKYKALRMEKFEITEVLRKLIVETDPPDLEPIIRPGNVRKLRADLEAHALVELPWDDIFAPSDAQVLGTIDDKHDDPEGDPTDGEFDVDEKSAPKSSERATAPDVKSPPPEPTVDDEDVIGCDVCKTPMAVTELTCPTCGTEYDGETGAITKRGALPRSKATGTKRGVGPAPKPAPRGATNGGWPVDNDDDIPF